ncbi:MAG: hypothetical protein ACI4TW_05050 [Prevotella sp.]
MIQDVPMYNDDASADSFYVTVMAHPYVRPPPTPARGVGKGEKVG